MKNFILIMLVSTLNMYASSSYSQQAKLSMELSGSELKEVLREIRKQTEFTVLYRSSDVEEVRNIEANFENATVMEILDECLQGTGLGYDLEDKVIVIHPVQLDILPESAGAMTEKKLLKGKVTDKDGISLPGVSVVIKGTNTGVSTDLNGNYSIELENRNAVLVFSFVGMLQQEIKYEGQNQLNVVLTEDTETLGEVVVTGYQTISKERVTGSYDIVKSEALENKLSMNVVERLEGMTPGLVVHKGEYTIRGISTFGDKKPLIVVDGFPIEGGVESINPNDIDQVTILKDAAAASIWGAKASNGVIVLTTKSGKADGGKFTINYSNNFSFQAIPDRSYLDQANSADVIDFEREGFPHRGIYNNPDWFYFSTPTKAHLIYDTYLKGVDVEDPSNADRVAKAEAEFKKLASLNNKKQLEDAFLRPTFNQEHNLTLSGSTNKSAYYASVNYNTEKGGYVGNKRNSVILNLKEILNVTDKMTVTLGGTFSFTKKKYSNVNSQVFNIMPYDMLKDEDGNSLPVYFKNAKTEIDYLKSVGGKDITYNPIDELDKYDEKNESFRNRLYAVLNYELLDGLNLDVRYQVEKGSSKYSKYSDPDSYEVANEINRLSYWVKDADGNKTAKSLLPDGGKQKQTRGDSNSHSLRAQLNLNKTLGDHSIALILGGEQSEVKSSATTTTKYGYNKKLLTHEAIDYTAISEFGTWGTEHYDKLYYQEGPKQPEQYDNFKEFKDRYVSFFGNMSYLFKEKYSLTLSARIDQSNLFGTDPKYRYTPLWSAGLGWNIADEDFFTSKFVNRLKLRATYGVNGNISKKAGPYLILNQSRGYFTRELMNSIYSYPNDKLRWEKTATINFGLDFAVLDNKISGTLDYYKRKSTDVFGAVKKDPTLGVRSSDENALSINNDGIEIALKSLNYKRGDFSWETSFTFSHNRNRVREVFEDHGDAMYWTWGTINVKDKPMDSFYRFKWAGLSKEGDPQVYDAKGNIVEPDKYSDMNDPDALVYKGTIHPVYSGSFSNVLNYKGFSLSAMFIYNGGHVMKNDIFTGNIPSTFAVHKDVNKRWRNSGDEMHTDIPRVDYKGYYGGTYARAFYKSSDIHILDASYVKLREVLLTYRLPNNLLVKTPFSSAQLRLQAKNIWYWAANDEGIDPEYHDYVNGRRFLPNKPTYSIGLNVNF